LLKGFYKCEYGFVGDRLMRSVMYVHEGRMLGGNSAFAHDGTYHEDNGEIVAEIISRRHTDDPNYQSLLGQDTGSISVRGRPDGQFTYRFEGTSPQIPGAVFRSMMTPLAEEPIPADAVGEGGIPNGLYSVHLRTLGGIDGDLNGVMLLNDGRILGGDAFFYYLGTYTSSHGRWKGQIVNQEHTPAMGENPVFGGHEVGIGFSGACNDAGAELEAAALAGKRSIRLTAALKLLRRV